MLVWEYWVLNHDTLFACEHYLPREVASWVPPMAGMFHWIKIDWTKHPSFGQKSVSDVEDEIFHAAIDKGTLARALGA